MKPVGLCPAVGSCRPNFGDALYSLHDGFCRLWRSQTRKISQKEPFLWDCSKIISRPITESESLWCICRTTFTLLGPRGITIY